MLAWPQREVELLPFAACCAGLWKYDSAPSHKCKHKRERSSNDRHQRLQIAVMRVIFTEKAREALKCGLHAEKGDGDITRNGQEGVIIWTFILKNTSCGWI